VLKGKTLKIAEQSILFVILQLLLIPVREKLLKSFTGISRMDRIKQES